ncbi:unnamed protein product [Cuscuta campestris]|uniref:Pentacotripeptide-repeat region of PRORP domain-containing protein n=1 Tax=Cuscuta campestris TaxID=132261 RepID=A0A484L0T9_9ASTE|nr:unnamed protein product [Cuscuta campestris]
MQMKSRKSLWAQIVRPAYPKFYVKSNLDNWVKDQKKKAPAGDLKRILLTLRNHGRFYQALQVYEWMRKKSIYRFSSSDHVVQFNLIRNVRGCYAAERYVRNLPKPARNGKTYAKLLYCYVRENGGDIGRSPLLHLQKMKELDFALSPRPFNEIMRICARDPEVVLEVLAELKKSNISPDNDSYRICISSFGKKHDLDRMERIMREMETQPHIVMDWCTYAVVAKFYERECLVDKATGALEKARVILQKKDTRRKGPNYLLATDYENVISTLVKLDELDEAIKFFREWEVLGYWWKVEDTSIPYTIIEEYIKIGKLREAFYNIEAWSRKGKIGVVILSRLLCKEYLKAGNVIQAFNCFRGTHHAFEVHPTVAMLFFEYLEEECGLVKPAAVQHEKSTQALINLDCKSITKPLVELNEAMKMVTEWEACGNWRGPNYLNNLKLIMEGYCKNSLFTEAEAMAEAWTREKRHQVAEVWFVLASHYQLHGKMVKGFECMRRFFSLTPGLKGNYSMMFWMFMNGIEYSRGTNNARGELLREYS